VKVFFIDYLQNIPLFTDNATTEIGRMTRILKGLATSLGITIVIVSQLNRRIETEKRKPRLSDLRQSGEIEEDADVVIFVYRNLEGDTPEDAEIIIAKNRNGPVGSFNLYFDEECVKFIGRE
jgi:replicative DNA helicase